MTGAIVNLICHLTFSHCDDSLRIPRTLVVGVCQGDNIKSFYLNIRKPLNLDKLTFKPREISLLLDKIDKAQSEADPDFGYGILSDFGDVEYEGRNRVINYATKMLMNEENDVDLIGGLINISGG